MTLSKSVRFLVGCDWVNAPLKIVLTTFTFLGCSACRSWSVYNLFKCDGNGRPMKQKRIVAVHDRSL